MKRIKLVGILSLTLLTLGACGTSNQTTNSSKSEETVTKESSNQDKKEIKDVKKTTFDTDKDQELETDSYTIKITDHKVIPAGEAGNEHGDEDIIAFWYDTTAAKEKSEGPKVTPAKAWMSSFTATQGKDNTLSITSLKDDAFSETQKEDIKPGETVKGAIAYKLKDDNTPVELTAQNISGETFGTITFDLK